MKGAQLSAILLVIALAAGLVGYYIKSPSTVYYTTTYSTTETKTIIYPTTYTTTETRTLIYPTTYTTTETRTIYSITTTTVKEAVTTYSTITPPSISGIEADLIAYVYHVVDGDTFDGFPSGRVRLADINAPEVGESGYYEAKDALTQLVLNKWVYLDVDDLYVMDRYNRLVA